MALRGGSCFTSELLNPPPGLPGAGRSGGTTGWLFLTTARAEAELEAIWDASLFWDADSEEAPAVAAPEAEAAASFAKAAPASRPAFRPASSMMLRLSAALEPPR